MAKVTLDKEMFKALASETRLDVLHALDERRKTTTEIASELELNKATVHEHLKLLTTVGLVKKIDEGRKWIYHELTWDGRKLLHPDQGTIFNVLLGLSILSAGGAGAMLMRAAGVFDSGGNTDTMEVQGLEEGAADADDGASSAAAAEPEAEGESDMAENEAMFADRAPEESLEADADGAGYGWVSLALAFASVILISLAIFLRKRK